MAHIQGQGMSAVAFVPEGPELYPLWNNTFLITARMYPNPQSSLERHHTEI